VLSRVRSYYCCALRKEILMRIDGRRPWLLLGALGLLLVPDVLAAAEVEEPVRAVVEIRSEEGRCFWSVSGDGELVRLPIEHEDYSALLLSTHFTDDQLLLTVAGEQKPLETTGLGTFILSLEGKAGGPVNVLQKSGAAGWDIQLAPADPTTAPGVGQCCSCHGVRILCCPNTGKCLSCGSCGSCCN
jgi:hypothetical protein